MKRKKLIFIVFFLCITGVLLFFQPTRLLAVIFTLVAFLLFILNKIVRNLLFIESKQYLNKPNYINNLQRNFDYMIIGSTKIKQFYNPDAKYSYLNYSFYDRSLCMAHKVLKNYFSLVKHEGTIVTTIDYSNDVRKMNYITPLDRIIISPILMEKCNYTLQQAQLALPILFNPFFSIKYLYYKIIGNRRNNKSWRTELDECKRVNKLVNFNKKTIREIQNILEEIILFCKERSLNNKIVLIESDYISIRANKILMNNLKNKYNSLYLTIIKNKTELNNLFG